MQIIRHLDDLPNSLRGGAVTVGNFDGVHKGHARIIAGLMEEAQRASGPSVVFTFDPHPVRLLRPKACPPPLTWTDRKAELLAEFGVDAMISYATDEGLLRKSAREFFDTMLCDALNAQAVVEGPNFFFGRNREGDVKLLRQFCNEDGILLRVVEPLELHGEIVSSSRVRRLIAAGDVAGAAELLTRPYRIRGMVTHGARRGAKIGFPTANLDAIDTLIPADGVYAGAARIDGADWPVALNIGPNPTFDDNRQKVEAHVLGFDADLYGRVIELDFRRRVRDVRAFANADELVKQIESDVRTVKDMWPR